MLLLLALLLVACSPVRPVGKIGLIAPFEGLYREDGYAALAGLRSALTDCAPPDLDLIPLALDDSADPRLARRAAQKLLVDPTVRAVIGPFHAAAPTIAASAPANVTWVTPYHLLQPASMDEQSWLDPLLAAVHAVTPDARIRIIGPPELLAHAQPIDDPRVLLEPDPPLAQTTVADNDAFLWFGDPAQGAAWLTALRHHSDAPFFLGTPYGVAVFAAHAPHATAAYWMLWQQVEYNQLSETLAPASTPAQSNLAYLTHQATCALLDRQAQSSLPNRSRWQVEAIRFP